MVLNSEDIWIKVLDLIKKELHPVSYNTWFSETKIHSIDDKTVTLQVPMTLHKKMLLSNYYDLLVNSFSQITGHDYNIECILEDEIIDNIEQVASKIIDNEEIIEDTDVYKHDSNLNKNFTFDNFVMGDTNKFAKTSALAVAQAPGTGFNPLLYHIKIPNINPITTIKIAIITTIIIFLLFIICYFLFFISILN